jgi:hypothetical protein
MSDETASGAGDDMGDENGVRPQAAADNESDDAITEDVEIPDEAFISPDEPIVRKERAPVPDEAFISPDEPIVRRERSTGVVVGMDGSTQHMRQLSGIHLEPDQVARILEETAHRIREDGVKAGLKVRPDSPRFEALLKAYLAGYFSTAK